MHLITCYDVVQLHVGVCGCVNRNVPLGLLAASETFCSYVAKTSFDSRFIHQFLLQCFFFPSFPVTYINLFRSHFSGIRSKFTSAIPSTPTPSKSPHPGTNPLSLHCNHHSMENTIRNTSKAAAIRSALPR